MASQNEFDREQLLAEELQPEEVRLLLERLGSREFGGSEYATVGAVVEASGADPVTVGGLLAQIRKEAFEEKYQAAFEDHEERIGTLEETIKPTRGALTQKEREEIVNVVREEHEERQAKNATSSFVIFVIGLIGILIFAFVLQAQQGMSQTPRPVQTTELGGLVFEEFQNGAVRVNLPDGTSRNPTDEETSLYRAFEAQTKG